MEATELKKGMNVTYVPRHSMEHKDRQLGNVTSWNDSFVFVDYGTGTSQATPYDLLWKGDKTFNCHNENNSVLDGAFGRCSKRCSECGG
jgi:hypothetical protein